MNKYLVCLMLLLWAAVHNCVAQSDPNLLTGVKPFGAYDETQFDSVNLANGNLVLHIPLFGYPQRGQAVAQLYIGYNNKGWRVFENCFNGNCTEHWAFQGSMVQLRLDDSMVGVNQRWVKIGAQNVAISTAYSSDGAAHPLRGYSTDGTGIYYNGFNNVSGPGQPILLDRRGAGFNSNQNLWNDANGNSIGASYYVFPPIGTSWLLSGETDTLGRSVGSIVDSNASEDGCATSPLNVDSAVIYGFPGTNGSTRQVKVCFATVHLKTNFQAKNYGTDDTLHSIAEYTGSVSNVIQSVIVNNGISWGSSPQWILEYGDSNPSSINYGDLTTVTLPTGGKITYGWTIGGVCHGTQPLTPVNRSVVSRSIDALDGTGPQTTTFGATSTDPAGNQIVHTFTGLGGTCSVYETQANFYQGSAASGNLLKSVITDYHWENLDPADPAIDPSFPQVQHVEPIRVTTKLPIPGGSDFLVSKTETDYNFTYGIVTEKREYDFGTNTPGPLVRKTTYTYQALTTPSYLTANLLDAVSQIVVTNGSGQTITQTKVFYDATSLQSSGISTHHLALANPGVRGNPTSTQQWLNTSGAWITTKQTIFYDTGLPYISKDALLRQTQFSYDPVYFGAYLTQTQSPDTGTVHHIVRATYDFNTGSMLSFTNQNGKTKTLTYDALSRLTSASLPDGGSVGYSYVDSPPLQIQRTVAIASGVNGITKTIFDGLGRVTQTQMTSDPDGITYVDTTYDGLGHIKTQSNPHRSTASPTDGITTYFFDALGRTCLIVPPDGTQPSGNTCPASQPLNTILTVYSANATTVTDQAGKSRKSITDGLGRLKQVFEDPSVLNYETDYTHDVLDNLTCTAQKGTNSGTFTSCASTPASWRPRSFTYDSLSRLTQAVNPESGAVNFIYDNAGNLLTKTGPKPNQTGTATVVATYSYDNLNRLAQKSFNDGLTLTVKYGYDGIALTGCTTAPPALTDSNPIGYRTSVCDGAGAESWSHDSMGRTVSDSRTTNGVTLTFPYTYNLDGSTKTVNYAGIENITFTQGGAGRYTSETSLFGSGNMPYTYVSAANYAPNGAMCSLAGALHNERLNISFNNRFQPLHWHFTETPWGGNPAPPPCQPPAWTASWVDLTYNYVDAGGHNNGNLVKINNNVNHAWSQNFTYDSLNRIATAQTDAVAGNQFGCWAETYTIDAWGNLLSNAYNPTTQSAYTGCVQEAPANLTSVVQPNNRLSGMGYTTDSAGNLIADGVHTFTYDAENHLLSTAQAGQTTVTYKYDGDGKRVQKSSGTLYWYGLSSKTLLETALTGGTNFAYYYFNGHLIGRRDWAGGVFTVGLYMWDALGNTRISANGFNGNWDWSEYYPYGGEWVIRSNVGNHYKFTGKERDTESGLDNFGARYLSSGLGRFDSADPITVTPARIADPQQLNLYSYVRNNPLAFTDSTGMIIDTSDLSNKDRNIWDKVVELANKKDANGNYVNPTLHDAYAKLDSDSRVFKIENDSSLGSGIAGRFEITKFNGPADFSEAKVELNFNAIKGISSTSKGDFDPSFKKYEGLFGKNGFIERLAETFGHEAGGHGLVALHDPAYAVYAQHLTNDANAAFLAANRAANQTRTPIPPDIILRMQQKDAVLTPSEEIAQRQEKIINGELRAKQQ